MRTVCLTILQSNRLVRILAGIKVEDLLRITGSLAVITYAGEWIGYLKLAHW
jgi:hypothetical protein